MCPSLTDSISHICNILIHPLRDWNQIFYPCVRLSRTPRLSCLFWAVFSYTALPSVLSPMVFIIIAYAEGQLEEMSKATVAEGKKLLTNT